MIQGVDPVPLDSDASDRHPVLIERQPAWIGREAERKIRRRRKMHARTSVDIATAEVRELHTEERASRGRIDLRGKMFLHDETGRARGEGIPLGAEERAGASLRDRRIAGGRAGGA